MSEHTAEPWFVNSLTSEENGSVYEIRDRKNDFVLAEIIDLLADDEANARRIVACVNAAKGIPIETLEGNTLPELAELVADVQVEARADAAEAALETAVGHLKRAASGWEYLMGITMVSEKASARQGLEDIRTFLAAQEGK